MTQNRPRPVGITILAVVEVLIGVAGLLASIAIIGLSALFATLPVIGGLLGTLGLILGGIVLFFSMIWLATGVGFFHGRGWSWTLGMVFSVLSLLGAIGALSIGLITGGIVGIFFWGLMIYYLTRSHVKIFFGKGGTVFNPSYITPYSLPSASMTNPSTSAATNQSPSAPNGSSQISNASSSIVSFPSAPKAIVDCPYCGGRLTMGSPKCMTCGATI